MALQSKLQKLQRVSLVRGSRQDESGRPSHFSNSGLRRSLSFPLSLRTATTPSQFLAPLRGGYEIGHTADKHSAGGVSGEEAEGRERAQRSAVKKSWRRLILWSRVKQKEEERVEGKLEKQITKVSESFGLDVVGSNTKVEAGSALLVDRFRSISHPEDGNGSAQKRLSTSKKKKN